MSIATPKAPAATLQVVPEPTYAVPRTWLSPLLHPVTGERVNPRHDFNPVKLEELAGTIRREGILQNLLVRIPEDAPPPETWTEDDHPLLELVGGERRWRAAEIAGLDRVPCVLRAMSFETAVEICIIENDQREDLNPIEQARGYRLWLSLPPAKGDPKRTQEALAERVKRSQEHVSHRLRLLDLPEAVVEVIEAGHVHATAARDHLVPLLRLNEDFRAPALQRVTDELAHLVGEDGAVPRAFLEERVPEIVDWAKREYGSPELFEAPAPAAPPPAAATAQPADADGAGKVSAQPIATCKYCGCTEEKACPGGCEWLTLDEDTGVGICDAPECEAKAAVEASPAEEPPAELSGAVPARAEAPTSPAAKPAAASPTTKPAAPPAKEPPRAAAPAPAAPTTAAPVVAAPAENRSAVPEGAGLVTATLAACGDRQVVITITPMPGGGVIFTAAPRLKKAGETDLVLKGTPAELDAQIVGAIDHHFN